MRLFVAVWPPAEVVDLLAGLDRPDVPNLRWTRPDQWHVTLRFLGEVDDVDAAAEALRSVRGAAAACEAVMGPEVRRLGSRVVTVPVGGLDEVAAEVVRCTGTVGEPPEDRPFRGHVTLARAQGKVAWGRVTGAPVDARWPVEEVALVCSRLHPHGARYETVERVPLR